MVTAQPTAEAVGGDVEMLLGASSGDEHDEVGAEGRRGVQCAEVKQREIIETQVDGNVLQYGLKKVGRRVWEVG